MGTEVAVGAPVTRPPVESLALVVPIPSGDWRGVALAVGIGDGETEGVVVKALLFPTGSAKEMPGWAQKYTKTDKKTRAVFKDGLKEWSN